MWGLEILSISVTKGKTIHQLVVLQHGKFINRCHPFTCLFSTWVVKVALSASVTYVREYVCILVLDGIYHGKKW